MKNTIFSILKVLALIVIYLAIALITLVIEYYLLQLFQKNIVTCPYVPDNTDTYYRSLFECFSIFGITITPDNSNTLVIIGLLIALLVIPGIAIYLIAKKMFKK